MSNLRKFRKNFTTQEEYRNYLEKGNWRAGPVLKRKNYNAIRESVYENVNFTRNTSKGIERLHPNHYSSPYNSLNTNTINKLSNKYGLTPQQVYRMFLHNHAYYLQKKSGLSTLGKLNIKSKINTLFPNNNNEPYTWKVYKKTSNGGWRRGTFDDINTIVFIPPERMRRFPFLRNMLIKTPNGVPPGNYMTVKNMNSVRGGKLFQAKTMQNKIEKAGRRTRGIEAARKVLLNLYAKVAERRRKLTGFKELAGLRGNNRRAGATNRGARTNNRGPVLRLGTEAYRRNLLRRAGLPPSFNFGNTSMLRKRTRAPNANNEARKAREKANNNARKSALAEWRRLINQAEANRRRAAGTARRITWRRNANGKVILRGPPTANNFWTTVSQANLNRLMAMPNGEARWALLRELMAKKKN